VYRKSDETLSAAETKAVCENLFSLPAGGILSNKQRKVGQRTQTSPVCFHFHRVKRGNIEEKRREVNDRFVFSWWKLPKLAAVLR
jgi:hypothetical protein